MTNREETDIHKLTILLGNDMYARSYAKAVIAMGYIPKEDSIEFVKICDDCKGTGDLHIDYVHKGPVLCEKCNGKGIILKEEL